MRHSLESAPKTILLDWMTNMDDRRSDEYSEWRKKVFKRDGRKCRFPGCKRRARLEIHHIIPWSISAALRFEVSNGVTLCSKCHASIKGCEGAYIAMFQTIIQQKKKK